MQLQIETVVQLAVGSVFMWAGFSKLLHPFAFARGASQYDMLPGGGGFVAALLVIPVELGIGLAHVTGWCAAAAAKFGIVMLVLFLIVVCRQLLMGRVMPCYCFGAEGSELLSWKSVVRLIVMSLGEVVVVRRSSLIPSSLVEVVRAEGLGVSITALTFAVCLCVACAWILDITELLCLGGAKGVSKDSKLARLCFREDI